MAAAKVVSAAQALLLAALLAGARADDVTWSQCKQENDGRGRALMRIQIDNNATSIQLKRCQITEINDNDFNGLPNLDHIYLNFNKIRVLDSAVFRVVTKVNFLFLDNNKLTSAPIFDDPSILPNLQVLNLENNLITALDNPDTFFSCEELLGIYLNDNEIMYIHHDVFRQLPKLNTLDLGGNRLKYIPNEMFSLPSLSYLRLESNLIEFLAPGAFRATELSYLYLGHNQLSYLPKYIVSELTSTNSSQKMFFTFFDNPFKCACKNELIAALEAVPRIEYKPHYTEKMRPCMQFEKTWCERLSETEYNARRLKKNGLLV